MWHLIVLAATACSESFGVGFWTSLGCFYFFEFVVAGNYLYKWFVVSTGFCFYRQAFAEE